MGKYGKASVMALNLLQSNKTISPIEAWEHAIKQIYPDSPSARSKGCPKSTFLGICETGLIDGIKPDHYTRSIKNKSYALNALALLKTDPSLINDEKLLWQKVINNKEKKYNQQMDVVIALWTGNFIKSKKSLVE